MPEQRLAFGPFVLNPEAGTLLRQGLPVAISYRGLLLLSAMARNAGEVLTKSQLLNAAWPGTAVEESNLSVQVASLRRLLGSMADGTEWIATVPRVQPTAAHASSSEAPPGFLAFDSLLLAGGDVPAAEFDENQPAAILYTSGSTARPKGVVLK